LPLFDNLFLSAGAQKTGTTWLYSLLKDHPDVYCPPVKELHYFAHHYIDSKWLSPAQRLTRIRQRLTNIDPEKANIRKIRADLQWYTDYLSDPVDDAWYANLFRLRGGRKYCADFSNLHCHLDAHGWKQVQERAANLKVLYVMRDPVHRLWSHIKFVLQLSNRTNEHQGWGPREYRAMMREHQHIWITIDYAKAVATMQQALLPGQLLIGFYERIHEDPPRWLAEIEDFLDIRHIAYPAEKVAKRVNVSPEQPMPAFFKDLFAEEFAQQCAALTKLGLQIPEQWSAYQDGSRMARLRRAIGLR